MNFDCSDGTSNFGTASSLDGRRKSDWYSSNLGGRLEVSREVELAQLVDEFEMLCEGCLLGVFCEAVLAALVERDDMLYEYYVLGMAKLKMGVGEYRITETSVGFVLRSISGRQTAAFTY